MYTYIILGITIIFLLVSLKFNREDRIFPTNIVYAMFILAFTFAAMNVKNWEDISQKTFFCLLLGLVTFGLVAAFVKSIFGHKRKVGIDEKIQYIKIQKCITLLVCFAGIIVLISYWRDISRIGSLLGGTDLASQIGSYRTAGVQETGIDTNISRFSSYGYLVLTGLAYYYMYVFLNNIFCNNVRIRNELINLIPIIEFILCSLLTGGRNPILRLIIGGFALWLLFYDWKNIDKGGSDIKLFAKIGVGVIIGLLSFSQLSFVIGRGLTDTTLFDYISKYIGAPIKLLDLFLDNPPAESNIWGSETFINLLKDLAGITGNPQWESLTMNKEWRTWSGFNLGNVYTAFRAYIYDFGYLGMTVMVSLLAVIYSSYHEYLWKKRPKTGLSGDFSYVIYIYFIHAMFYLSIDDRFYQSLLSSATLKTLFVSYIAWLLFPRIKFKLENKDLR